MTVDDLRAFYETVGRRIREARTRRKPRLTQEGLAELVSLTRTSVTNVEKGRQKLSLHTLADMATALEVDLASLLPEAPSKVQMRLDKVIRNKPQAEKAFITSVIRAAENERDDHGP